MCFRVCDCVEFPSRKLPEGEGSVKFLKVSRIRLLSVVLYNCIHRAQIIVMLRRNSLTIGGGRRTCIGRSSMVDVTMC